MHGFTNPRCKVFNTYHSKITKLYKGVIGKEELILGALLGLSSSGVAARFSSECGVLANMYFLIT